MAAHTLSASSSSPISVQIQNRLCSIHPAQNNLSLQSCGLQTSWLGIAGKLSLRFRNLRPLIPKQRSIMEIVVFSLPTGNPERLSYSTDKVPMWSQKAVISFARAQYEAKKLYLDTTGTEALLLGILNEGTNFASKFLRENGITLTKVRKETIKLLEEEMGSDFATELPPLGEDAQKAIDWAFDEKLKSGDSGEITTAHLLVGVWSQEESPGHKILTSFGFNDEKIKELKSKISKPGILAD